LKHKFKQKSLIGFDMFKSAFVLEFL